MTNKPTASDVVKVRASRRFLPTTRLSRVTFWSGIMSALLLPLRWITHPQPGSALHGWGTFFTLLFIVSGFFLSIRRLRRMVILWRLRNRLAMAYFMFGVMPVVLLLLMGGAAGYMFAGQFANYVAISDLQSKLQHLDAENDALAAQLNTLNRAGALNLRAAAIPTADSDGDFAQRTVTVWQGDNGYVMNTSGSLLNVQPEKVPAALTGDFNGIVVDGETLHLRAIKHFGDGVRKLTVISSEPITPDLLQTTAARLGAIRLIPPYHQGGLQLPPPPNLDAFARPHVIAGHVPPASNRFDIAFRFYTVFKVVDWQTGQSHSGGVGVTTRPSLLYNVLFATLGNRAIVIRDMLLALAVFFGLIELVALFIALMLSRRITGSVARLYTATQHVNRGDLTHRIQVRSHDQMATLEESFNSMTESLVNLVAEQKEKQRLESELAIAREVQDLLFPHSFAELPSLEVFGVCRPARSVSGDYYDFISLGTDRLALAIGDISGKGISAALLMATVHAFVRAYSLEPDMVLPPELRVEAISDGDPSMYYRTGGAMPTHLSSGMLMTTLNYQLFRCTPPEKYATMFLGCYNATRRELKYCNAGHLPPIVLHQDGTLSRLTASGTVIGLFDGATYSESTITLAPGDIFIAFSDGVTEPENESVEFGEQRLIGLIQQHRDQPLPYIAERITSAVEEWIGGAELPDDLTVILARATVV